MKQVIVVHFGRSGSTVLAKMIEAHSKAIWLHEMYTLIGQQMENKSDYRFTSAEMIGLLDKEVEHRAKDSTELIGVESKLLNFLQTKRYTMQEYFRALSKKNTWDVVVLRRRNVLARVLSSFRAASTGMYHVPLGNDLKPVEFTLPLSHLHDADTGVRDKSLPEFMDKVAKYENRIIRSVKNETGLALELWYEDDIREDPTVAYRKFKNTFGLDGPCPSISLRRTSQNIKSEVTNWGKIESALKDTDFSWMVDDL